MSIILTAMAVAKWIAVGAAVGAVASTVMIAFWEDIRQWLTSVAANAVEKAFGYKARDRMCKSIVKIDRIVNAVRNKATVYTKKDELDTHFLRTEVVAECPSYEIDAGALEEIRKHGEIVREYKYTT